MVVNEAFVGRIPEIEEVYEAFCDLRNNFQINKIQTYTKKIDRLEKAIENMWGFKAFAIQIVPSNIVNADTFPVSSNIDMDPYELMEVCSTGYKWKNGSNIAAISRLYNGLFSNPALSNEEAFAIILHEIGHSFNYRSPEIASLHTAYVNSSMAYIALKVIMSVIMLPLLPLSIAQILSDLSLTTKIGKMFRVNAIRLARKVPLFRNARINWDQYLSDVQTASYNKKYKNYVKSKKNEKYLEKQVKELHKNQEYYSDYRDEFLSVGRTNERLSDDFANVYGFGPYLAIALLKMDNPANQDKGFAELHEDPSIADRAYKIEALSREINDFLGVHPSTVDRMLNMLDSMEYDLKNDKNMPDKVKKELQGEYDKLKKIVQDTAKQKGEAGKNKNEYYKALMALGIKEGNSESEMEHSYNDFESINKDFYDKLQEETFNLTEGLDSFDDYLEDAF